ncbi:hypothetical protein ORI89_17430 [Sphingobacterium sp. UT-1RO-CII-1]|nr:hypothetical protein [Sphingobacterium sp. UT-1RO-CII-1]
MYSAVIPDIDSDDSSSGTGSSIGKGSVTGAISLFDIGKRLSEGKGV